MDIGRLQDRISYGMGVAARKYGSPYVVYRPFGTGQPLCERNRIIDIPAAFQPFGRSTNGGSDPVVWEATLDSHYTQEGDYLFGDRGTFFIGMQWPGLPVRCVLTNGFLTIVRPSFAAQGSYSGLSATGGTVVINNWPAHLSPGQNTSSVKGPMVAASRSLLLPKQPASIQVADVVTDDSGATYIVNSSEQSASGWRLMARSGTP